MKNSRVLLGRAVRKKRLAIRLSQEELAERAAVHRTYIGQVERGETNISLDNLVKLAAALGVAVRDLVSDLN